MTDNGHPPARYMLFDEFLAAEEWRGLLDVVDRRAGEFRQTSLIVANGAEHVDNDFRRSVMLDDLGHVYDLFVQRLMAFSSLLFWRLRYPAFSVGQYEIQMTGTGDGEYFRPHTDQGPGVAATRAITFVYFFHAEPRPFTGGELVLYDGAPADGDGDAVGGAPAAQTIEPAQNQIVFFPSDTPNEIRPVSSPSGAFRDRHFTVNGWLHR
jgi:SM-20-related protein